MDIFSMDIFSSVDIHILHSGKHHDFCHCFVKNIYSINLECIEVKSLDDREDEYSKPTTIINSKIAWA